MQKSTHSSQSAASVDTNAGFTSSAARTAPPVATFRQYLDGQAEAFELARRNAQAAARIKSGGAPGADGRRFFAH